MTISAGSIPCPPYIADQEQHRKAITNWMMRVSPFVTPANTSSFVTQDSLSAALAGVGAGTFVTASEFNVQGDTQRIYRNVTIALSASSLNVPNASFSAADIGKAITLQWNSATGVHTSTILSVSSATNIGLSTQFPAALASAPAIVTFGTDDRSAMQAAIAGCISLGGATLYLPAGYYTIGGMLSIGSTMSILGDGWKGLRAIAGVTTHDWATTSPPFGTILFANFHGNSASACIRVAAHSCQIRNMEFEVSQPMPGINWACQSAPWCIKAYRAPFEYEGGDGLYIENVMLRNPSKGIRFQGTSRGWVNGLFGQPFVYGIYVSGNYDVFRAENVHWWPFYDVGPYVMAAQPIFADGIVLGKVDNPMFSNIFGFHLRSLFRCFNSNEVDINPTGWTQRMHVTNAGADDCQFGFFIQDNAGIDVTDMYAYCFSTSAAAVPSCAFYCTSAIGQTETTRLNLTNIDITGCTGNGMRFETPVQLNVSNLRLQSFNQSNLGYAAISMARSSTANIVNVIDYNNHFASPLFEALTATAVFNYGVGADISGNIRITGGINGLNGLSISGGAVFSGNVFIDGGINGRNGLSISGGAVFSGNMFVGGGINGLNGLSISGGAVFSGNVNVGGGLNVLNGISVSGGMVLTGAANIGYDTSISGALTVVGGINGRNGLSISGGAVLTGAMNVGGDLSVGGALLVTQGITGKNGLSISGGIITTGNVFVGGDLTVSGNVIAGGITFTNLFIPGTTTLSGATVITQGLTVRNGVSISGGIATTGSGIIGADISISGVAYVGGNAHVQGNLTVVGTAVLGGINFTNLYVDGTSTLSGVTVVLQGLTCKNGISVSGGCAITGNFIGQAADLSGGVSIGSTLLVTGGITGKAGLSISGGVAMTGNIIAQAADFSSTLSVGSTAVVTGALSVGGAAIVTGNMSVNGSLVVFSGITSKAGLSVSGGIAITGAFIMGVPGDYANDGAAAAGGVSVGQLYRNGSALQIRVS